MSFDSLGLSDRLLRAVRAEGYHTATPIQSQAIPTVLEGRDLMGCAQTGTGKTAAFALPTFHRLAGVNPPERDAGKAGRRDRSAPFERSFSRQLANLRHRSRRVSPLTANTPACAAQSSMAASLRDRRSGRCRPASTSWSPRPADLLDLMNQGYVNLASIEILILDEADQMLDMGFLPDLRRIVASVPKTSPNADVLGHDAPGNPRARQSLAARTPICLGRPSGHAGRASPTIGLSRRNAQKAGVVGPFPANHALHTDARLRADEARSGQDRQATGPVGCSTPWQFTATRARTYGNGRLSNSSRSDRPCWSRPTSRPEGLTSITSRTSSTTIFRRFPKSTSTGSDELAAPAPPELRRPFVGTTNAVDFTGSNASPARRLPSPRITPSTACPHRRV